MPMQKQTEASRLKGQTASGVRLGRHISTFQIYESNIKTAKLASFCQIDLDPETEIEVVALEGVDLLSGFETDPLAMPPKAATVKHVGHVGKLLKPLAPTSQLGI